MSACRTFLAAVVCVALTARLVDSLAMPALSEADVEAALERSKREQSGNCGLHPFNVSVEDGGCLGSILAVGCVGRCETTVTPHYYMSRHEANIADPWISSCKCCSHTRNLPFRRNVSLQCTDGRTLNKTVIVLLPMDCGCSACA